MMAELWVDLKALLWAVWWAEKMVGMLAVTMVLLSVDYLAVLKVEMWVEH
jgi:hypothetical protein